MAIKTFEDAMRWLKERERWLDRFIFETNCLDSPSYRLSYIQWQEMKKVIQIIDDDLQGYENGYNDGWEAGLEESDYA